MKPINKAVKMKENKSAFVETFGDSPSVRVIDFFLTFPDFYYSKTEVAREVEISPITIEKIWAWLIEKGFIVETKKLGRAQLCKLNKGSQIVKELLRLDARLTEMYLKKEMAVEA